MMHQYTCPKCKTVLKREQPVAEGKKIKCPKCANIFAAILDAKAEHVKAGKSKLEEDDRNPYAVVNEEEEDDKMRQEKQRAAMGLVRDRFEKQRPRTGHFGDRSSCELFIGRRRDHLRRPSPACSLAFSRWCSPTITAKGRTIQN